MRGPPGGRKILYPPKGTLKGPPDPPGSPCRLLSRIRGWGWGSCKPPLPRLSSAAGESVQPEELHMIAWDQEFLHARKDALHLTARLQTISLPRAEHVGCPAMVLSGFDSASMVSCFWLQGGPILVAIISRSSRPCPSSFSWALQQHHVYVIAHIILGL